MGKRTVVTPKHKIFDHKQYVLFKWSPLTEKDARTLAKRLRNDQVVRGVRFRTDTRVAKFGDKWAVYTWENRYYSKTKRKMVMRR